jgi:hypothetical protein
LITYGAHVTTSTTVTPARLLTQVADGRQTGALVVGGHPGGAVYVLEGHVIYAESPAAPGVGELLTSSGRLAGRTWQNALDQGTSTARVGRLLVDQGHLTRGELELCVLGATYDAAYFALSPASAPVDFLDGATHWLGAVVHIDPVAVNREVRRRIRLLDEIFPDARVDTAVVSPVARPPRERITLTAPQWELLVHADGQRTPADLALLLGKAGYATIQELRRLAALGLIELPEVRGEQPEFVRLPRARGTAVDVRRPSPRSDDGPTVPVIAGARRPAPAPDPPRHSAVPRTSTASGSVTSADSLAPAGPPGSDGSVGSLGSATPIASSGPVSSAVSIASSGPVSSAVSIASSDPVSSAVSIASSGSVGSAGSIASGGSGGPAAPVASGGYPASAEEAVYRPPRLARRKPGAKLPKELAGEAPPPHPGTDEVLLKRIRTALRALR